MAFSISLSTTSLTLAFIIFFFFFFSFLPPKSVGLVLSRSGRGGGGKEMKLVTEKYEKMVIGSRPPGCENKCKSCRPCRAAVVVPVPEHRMKMKDDLFASSSREEEDSYYLLSWKCRCGNKIYQP